MVKIFCVGVFVLPVVFAISLYIVLHQNNNVPSLRSQLISAQLDIEEMKKHEAMLYRAYQTLDYQIDILLKREQ